MKRHFIFYIVAAGISIQVIALVGCKKDEQNPVQTTTQTSTTISLSTAAISFSSIQGGGNPSPQMVNVTNGGSGSLTGLSTSTSYESGAGWLTASLNTTTAPATITLQVTTGSLSVGTYTATVSVVSSAASNNPKTIGVTFTITSSASPSITLSTSSINFSAQEGGSNPSSQTVNVTNGGSGSLTGLSTSISYTSGTGWLTKSLNSTTAPATVTLQATTGSLTAGTYTATVSVLSAVASNSPRTIAVTFTISSGSSPTISAPVTSTGTFTVAISFSWPAQGSSEDRYELEQSTTSPTSGFTNEYTSPKGTRTSPYNIQLTKATGTYYYRARVYSSMGYSSFSTVATVVVTTPTIISKTFYASYDNSLMYNSNDPNIAKTVYPNSYLSVGTNYFYGIDPFSGGYYLFGYLSTASVMKFDVQSTIAGKTIVEAKLRLYEYILPAVFMGNYRLAAISSTWNPSTITWNIFLSMSYYTSSTINFIAIASTVVPLEFDVTTTVQNWANGTYSINGFQIWEPNPVLPGQESYQSTEFQSLEVYNNSSYRPQLYIRYQ